MKDEEKIKYPFKPSINKNTNKIILFQQMVLVQMATLSENLNLLFAPYTKDDSKLIVDLRK